MTAVVVMLGAVVSLLSVLVAGLLRSHADILRELHSLREGGATAPRLSASTVRPGVGLPRGSGADAQGADIIGVEPNGDAVKLAMSGTPHRTLLVFLSTGCLSCRAFWEALADTRTFGLDPSVRPVIVTKGVESESLSAIMALAPADVPTISSTAAWADYSVVVAPYAILVDGSGRIVGEGAAATWEQVRELMHQALADVDAGADADLRRRVDALRRRRGATGDRDSGTDEVLLRAGIGPEHPSLWPQDGGQPQGGVG